MPKSQPQKRLILTVGDKGGTGKSTFSKVLWDRLRDNHSARAFDADGTTGSFVSVYGNYDKDGNLIEPQPSTGVVPIYLHGSDRDRDEIVAVTETGATTVLVDLPATSLTVLQRIEAEWGFASAAGENGYRLTVVNVVSPYRSSLANVLTTFDLFPTADNVVVLNQHDGDESDYVLWFGDDKLGIAEATGKKRLDERGGVAIWFPRAKSRVLALVDAKGLTYSDALHGDNLDTVDRRYLQRWLSDCYSEFEPAEHLLGLAPETVAAAAARG